MPETENYNDSYPTCEAVYVSFTLRKKNCGEETLEEYDKALCDGFQTHHATNREYKGYFVWSLSSKDKINSLDARRHLDWILDIIEPNFQLIKQSCAYETASLSVAWFSRYGHGGPTLSPSQMLRIARLGLELWFDFYYVGDTDDDE